MVDPETLGPDGGDPDGTTAAPGRHRGLIAVLAAIALLLVLGIYGVRGGSGGTATGAHAGLPGAEAATEGAAPDLDFLVLQPSDNGSAGSAGPTGSAGSGAIGGPAAQTLVRVGPDGRVLARMPLAGTVAPLTAGADPCLVPLPGGRLGLAVTLWGRDGLQVLDTALTSAPAPLDDGTGERLLGADARTGVWTGAAGTGWDVRLHPVSGDRGRPLPAPAPGSGADATPGAGAGLALGVVRAPGTDEDGVVLIDAGPGLPAGGGAETSLLVVWPDGRSTGLPAAALAAVGPDYLLVADRACSPAAGCAFSVAHVGETGTVVRQPVHPPRGWTFPALPEAGRVAFTTGAAAGFVLPVTRSGDGATALAWAPAWGGRAALVPGSQAPAGASADGPDVTASDDMVFFTVPSSASPSARSAAGGATASLMRWSPRSASALPAGTVPSGRLLCALPHAAG